MANFLTSDNHFFHLNVIKYCNRPFSDLSDMNQQMIDRWNSVVQPTDTVYHLGDFILSNDIRKIDWILNSLNGKIFLVRGNHDKAFLKKLPKCHPDSQSKFIDIRDYYSTTFQYGLNKYYVVMMHYPILRWDKCHHQSTHLHGHSHNRPVPPEEYHPRRVNIGVDMFNFYPVELSSLLRSIDKKEQT